MAAASAPLLLGRMAEPLTAHMPAPRSCRWVVGWIADLERLTWLYASMAAYLVARQETHLPPPSHLSAWPPQVQLSQAAVAQQAAAQRPAQVSSRLTTNEKDVLLVLTAFCKLASRESGGSSAESFLNQVGVCRRGG